jgi:hypothetical protein
MRFMMLMIPGDGESVAPGSLPDVDGVIAMMKYNQALWQAGVLLALDGLHPSSMGARVSFAEGRPRIVDGTKDTPSGYWMIDVASRDEAIAWASRCPAVAGEAIEVRQVQEFTDFSADVQQALTAHADMRVRGAKQDGPRRHLIATS